MLHQVPVSPLPEALSNAPRQKAPGWGPLSHVIPSHPVPTAMPIINSTVVLPQTSINSALGLRQSLENPHYLP